MEVVLGLFFLGVLIRYWRWWTIAVLVAGGIHGGLGFAVLVIGFIAEQNRKKKREAQAGLAATTGAAEGGLGEEPPNAQARRADESLAQPSSDWEEKVERFGVDSLGTQTQVDINTARREELLTLPGIGAAEAGLILKRTQSGQGFGSLEELEDSLRLKPHKTSQLRGRVRFSSCLAAGAPRGAETESSTPRRGRVID